MTTRSSSLLLVLVGLVLLSACQPTPTSHKSPSELIGKSAPDVGSEHIGKAVEDEHPCTVRVIWATWCEPCKDELPLLDDWMDSAETPADVELVLGDPDTTRDAAERFLETHNVIFGTALGKNGILRAHGLRGIPTAFLIGPTGDIVAYKEGPFTESSLHEFLNRDACKPARKQLE